MAAKQPQLRFDAAAASRARAAANAVAPRAAAQPSPARGQVQAALASLPKQPKQPKPQGGVKPPKGPGGIVGFAQHVLGAPAVKAVLKGVRMPYSYIASHASDIETAIAHHEGLGTLDAIAKAIPGVGGTVAAAQGHADLNPYHSKQAKKDFWAQTGAGTYYQRALNNNTWDDHNKFLHNTWVKRGVGLTGDIAMDPLSYMMPEDAFLKGSASEVAGRMLGEESMHHAGQIAAFTAGEKAATEAAAKGASESVVNAARAAAERDGYESGQQWVRERAAEVAQRGKKVLSSEDVRTLNPRANAGGGLGWRVPGTGRVGRTVAKAFGKNDLEEKIIPLISKDKTNLITGALGAPKNALRTSRLAQAFADKMGGELGGYLHEGIVSGDPERAYAALGAKRSMGVGRASAAAGLRMNPDAYEHLNLGAGEHAIGPTLSHAWAQDVIPAVKGNEYEAIKAVESNDPERIVNTKGATELKHFFDSAYEAMDREGMAKGYVEGYVPRQLTELGRQRREEMMNGSLPDVAKDPRVAALHSRFTSGEQLTPAEERELLLAFHGEGTLQGDLHKIGPEYIRQIDQQFGRHKMNQEFERLGLAMRQEDLDRLLVASKRRGVKNAADMQALLDRLSGAARRGEGGGGPVGPDLGGPGPVGPGGDLGPMPSGPSDDAVRAAEAEMEAASGRTADDALAEYLRSQPGGEAAAQRVEQRAQTEAPSLRSRLRSDKSTPAPARVAPETPAPQLGQYKDAFPATRGRMLKFADKRLTELGRTAGDNDTRQGLRFLLQDLVEGNASPDALDKLPDEQVLQIARDATRAVDAATPYAPVNPAQYWPNGGAGAPFLRPMAGPDEGILHFLSNLNQAKNLAAQNNTTVAKAWLDMGLPENVMQHYINTPVWPKEPWLAADHMQPNEWGDLANPAPDTPETELWNKHLGQTGGVQRPQRGAAYVDPNDFAKGGATPPEIKNYTQEPVKTADRYGPMEVRRFEADRVQQFNALDDKIATVKADMEAMKAHAETLPASERGALRARWRAAQDTLDSLRRERIRLETLRDQFNADQTGMFINEYRDPQQIPMFNAPGNSALDAQSMEGQRWEHLASDNARSQRFEDAYNTQLGREADFSYSPEAKSQIIRQNNQAITAEPSMDAYDKELLSFEQAHADAKRAAADTGEIDNTGLVPPNSEPSDLDTLMRHLESNRLMRGSTERRALRAVATDAENSPALLKKAFINARRYDMKYGTNEAERLGQAYDEVIGWQRMMRTANNMGDPTMRAEAGDPLLTNGVFHMPDEQTRLAAPGTGMYTSPERQTVLPSDDQLAALFSGRKPAVKVDPNLPMDPGVSAAYEFQFPDPRAPRAAEQGAPTLEAYQAKLQSEIQIAQDRLEAAEAEAKALAARQVARGTKPSIPDKELLGGAEERVRAADGYLKRLMGNLDNSQSDWEAAAAYRESGGAPMTSDENATRLSVQASQRGTQQFRDQQAFGELRQADSSTANKRFAEGQTKARALIARGRNPQELLVQIERQLTDAQNAAEAALPSYAAQDVELTSAMKKEAAASQVEMARLRGAKAAVEEHLGIGRSARSAKDILAENPNLFGGTMSPEDAAAHNAAWAQGQSGVPSTMGINMAGPDNGIGSILKNINDAKQFAAEHGIDPREAWRHLGLPEGDPAVQPYLDRFLPEPSTPTKGWAPKDYKQATKDIAEAWGAGDLKTTQSRLQDTLAKIPTGTARHRAVTEAHDLVTQQIAAEATAGQIGDPALAASTRFQGDAMRKAAEDLMGVGPRNAPRRFMQVARAQNAEHLAAMFADNASHTLQALQQSEGLMTTRDIADAVNAINKVQTPEGMKGFLKYYDKVQTYLKAWQLSTPGFHIRNRFGGIFNNYLAGVDIGAQLRFRSALKAFNAGELSDEEASWMHALLSHTGGGQYSHHELGVVAGQKSGWNPFSPSFKPLRMTADYGSSVEQDLRGALFWDRMAKGRSVQEALADVDKYHFDYSNLSNFETGVVKRVLPFYTWTRYNFPLQIQELADNPARYRWYQQFANTRNGKEDPGKPVANYIQNDMFGIPLPTHVGGGQDFATLDLPFNRTMSDAMPTADNWNPARLGTYPSLLDNQLAQTAVPIKLPLELALSRQFYKGIPLADTSKTKGSFLTRGGPAGALANFMGGQKKADYMLDNLFPGMSQYRRLAGDAQFRKRMASSWASYMGVPVRANTKEDQQNEMMRRAALQATYGAKLPSGAWTNAAAAKAQKSQFVSSKWSPQTTDSTLQAWRPPPPGRVKKGKKK